MDYTELINKIKSLLSEKRYNHSYSTALQTKVLTNRFYPSCNANYPYIVGLYHDIARSWSDEKLLEYVKTNSLKAETEELEHPQLLHALVAADMITKEDKTVSNEVVKAIRWHSLGSVEMGKLGAILYVSDYLEPLRQHLSESKRASLLKTETLEKLVLAVIEQSQLYLAKNNLTTAKSTLKLKEYLLNGGVFK